MFEMIRRKQKGLISELDSFNREIFTFDMATRSVYDLTALIAGGLKDLGFDDVSEDAAGNVTATLSGYSSEENMVVISHIDLNDQRFGSFKAGIISSINAVASLKRTMIPLKGNLIFCCVPRSECCDFGIEYLFEHTLKKKIDNIKAVILCEPTDYQLALGHKGRMEYEIIVKGELRNSAISLKGINILTTMFPLVNELEKVSQTLPHDYLLGNSRLSVKDVLYESAINKGQNNQFKIIVDREFVPEESVNAILDRAKSIARNIYKDEPSIAVDTSVVTETVKTNAGLEVAYKKEFKPWRMPSHDKLVLSSLEVLRDNGFRSDVSYWRTITTEGSYTYGKLNIPTIGFGLGREAEVLSEQGSFSDIDFEKAVYGYSLIIVRNIGMPCFGWSSDEI